MGSDAIRQGDIIGGRYRVGAILSRSRGLLFEGVHTDFEQRVVIRVLPASLCDPKEVRRFQREARILTRLESEHVARLLDVGTLPSGALFYVRPYLEGATLDGYLKLRGALPLDEATLLILQAAEAVAESHVHNYILRELSPSHLFLTRRVGGEPLVKVIDFGTAKVMRDPTAAGGGGEFTATSMFGLSSYSSPEVVRKLPTIDRRADIWSLGAIFYHMLAGRLPFDGEMAILMLQICREQAAPLTDVRADIPAEVAQIIEWAMAKEPDARFPNVYGLAHALAPFASSEGMLLIQRIGTMTNATEQRRTSESTAPPELPLVHAEAPPREPGKGSGDRDSSPTLIRDVESMMRAKRARDSGAQVPAAAAPEPAKASPAPVAKRSAPALERPAPVAKRSAPMLERPAPVLERPAPVLERPAPVLEWPAPVEEPSAPVEEPSAPVEEGPPPIEDILAPIEDLLTPLDETLSKAGDTPAPGMDLPMPMAPAAQPGSFTNELTASTFAAMAHDSSAEERVLIDLSLVGPLPTAPEEHGSHASTPSGSLEPRSHPSAEVWSPETAGSAIVSAVAPESPMPADWRMAPPAAFASAPREPEFQQSGSAPFGGVQQPAGFSPELPAPGRALMQPAAMPQAPPLPPVPARVRPQGNEVRMARAAVAGALIVLVGVVGYAFFRGYGKSDQPTIAAAPSASATEPAALPEPPASANEAVSPSSQPEDTDATDAASASSDAGAALPPPETALPADARSAGPAPTTLLTARPAPTGVSTGSPATTASPTATTSPTASPAGAGSGAGSAPSTAPSTEPSAPKPADQTAATAEAPQAVDPSEMGTLIAVAVGGSCAFSINDAARGTMSTLKSQIKAGTYVVTCKPASGVAQSKSVTIPRGGVAMATFKIQ